MDRNVKIALGCGGAGCLGLIVVAVAAGLIYYFTASRSTTTNRNSNISYNRNSRSATTNSNTNSNSNSGSDDDSSSSNSSSSSSMSSDDQHRLFHAATVSADPDLLRRVQKKLGLLDSNNTPNEKNVDFATDHVSWVFRNSDFVQEMNTQAKGRAYVNAHIDD